MGEGSCGDGRVFAHKVVDCSFDHAVEEAAEGIVASEVMVPRDVDG